MNKVMSLHDAVAKYVENGDTKFSYYDYVKYRNIIEENKKLTFAVGFNFLHYFNCRKTSFIRFASPWTVP